MKPSILASVERIHALKIGLRETTSEASRAAIREQLAVALEYFDWAGCARALALRSKDEPQNRA